MSGTGINFSHILPEVWDCIKGRRGLIVFSNQTYDQTSSSLPRILVDLTHVLNAHSHPSSVPHTCRPLCETAAIIPLSVSHSLTLVLSAWPAHLYLAPALPCRASGQCTQQPRRTLLAHLSGGAPPPLSSGLPPHFPTRRMGKLLTPEPENLPDAFFTSHIQPITCSWSTYFQKGF